MAQYELNLRDYLRVLRKRKLIVIFAAFSLGFFSFFFATLQKPIPLYRAESSVKVEQSTTATGMYIESLNYGETSNLDTQSAIIKIEVVDSDPKFAQQLANITAEVYKEQNTLEKNKRIIEAKKYIEKQLVVVEEKLKVAQENLRLFREKNRLVTIESETGETLHLLNESEKEYAYAKQEKAEIESLITELKNQKLLPKESVEGFYAEKVGPIFSSLNTKLVDLYAQRDLLLLDYNTNHPEIQRMDVQIDKITTNMINHLNDQVKRLVEREQFLSDQIVKMKDKFNVLPRLGFELERIEHELDTNKNLYTNLKERHQEVLISDAEKIEEVSIVRPALLPRSPINPPTTMRTAAIGTIVDRKSTRLNSSHSQISHSVFC